MFKTSETFSKLCNLLPRDVQRITKKDFVKTVAKQLETDKDRAKELVQQFFNTLELNNYGEVIKTSAGRAFEVGEHYITLLSNFVQDHGVKGPEPAMSDGNALVWAPFKFFDPALKEDLLALYTIAKLDAHEIDGVALTDSDLWYRVHSGDTTIFISIPTSEIHGVSVLAQHIEEMPGRLV